MIPEQRYRDEHKKLAFWDGCQAAANGADRLSGPNYPTYDERAAFKEGWDDWWSLNAPAFRDDMANSN